MLAALMLGAVACEGDNQGPPTEDKPCASNTDCTTAGQAVCDLGATEPVCVQCLPGPSGDAAACTGTTPVCSDAKSCRACSAHAECANSDTCLPSGACAETGQVLYVAANGAGTTCAKDAPCTVGTAFTKVSSTQPYVRIKAGKTMGVVLDLDGNGNAALKTGNVVVLGEAGAILEGPGNMSPVVALKNGAKVRVWDLTLQGSDRDLVRVESGSEVALSRCKLTAGRTAVRVNSATATVDASTLSGNAQGIAVDDMGSLTLTRSSVRENGLVAGVGGIVVANGAKAVIVNNFIVGNGDGGGSSLGGVVMSEPGEGSKLEYNTIVDNKSDGGATDAGGVVCDQTGFAAPGNLIYRNTGGTGGSVQTLGRCGFTASYVMAAAGTDTALKFKADQVAPNLRDYHLTAASPAMVRDVASAVCTGLADYDGESRPKNGACDLGADEF